MYPVIKYSWIQISQTPIFLNNHYVQSKFFFGQISTFAKIDAIIWAL